MANHRDVKGLGSLGWDLPILKGRNFSPISFEVCKIGGNVEHIFQRDYIWIDQPSKHDYLWKHVLLVHFIRRLFFITNHFHQGIEELKRVETDFA